MLKTSIKHNTCNILADITSVKLSSVKSNDYYKGYKQWFNGKFVPSYNQNESSIIGAYCKTYDTLLGFALLKHDGKESKISNLSPLVDGVGITQCLLDACEFYFENDYDIYIPNVANDLIKKVDKLGFHHVLQNQSLDGTIQHKFIKPRNISWI